MSDKNNLENINNTGRDGQSVDVATQTDLSLNPLSMQYAYNPELRFDGDDFYLSWVMSYPVYAGTPPPLSPLFPGRPEMRAERQPAQRRRGARRATSRRGRSDFIRFPATFNNPLLNVAGPPVDVAGPSVRPRMLNFFNNPEMPSVRLPPFDTFRPPFDPIRPPRNNGVPASPTGPQIGIGMGVGFSRPLVGIAIPRITATYPNPRAPATVTNPRAAATVTNPPAAATAVAGPRAAATATVTNPPAAATAVAGPRAAAAAVGGPRNPLAQIDFSDPLYGFAGNNYPVDDFNGPDLVVACDCENCKPGN